MSTLMQQIHEKYGVVCDTDSYKMSHAPLYPKGTTKMVSYIESRGGEYDTVLNFGLQMILKSYFMERLTHVQVDNIIQWEKEHFGGNIADNLEIALRTVVDEYDGYMPIKVYNAPEGLMIPNKNVLIIIASATDDERTFSLVSYFETKLLRVWNTMTVGTKSMHMRKSILEKLMISSDQPEATVNFMLQDFGSRGCTSLEQAALAGAAHLVAFRGSDTVVGIMAAELAYGERMAGFSIPATEHSTTTSHGIDGEIQVVQQIFDNYAKPGALFATVIDSYDALAFIRNIAPKFKQKLLDSGAKWVFRPDSGDPINMPIKCVEELDLIFGHTVNEKGFKVLNNVGVIQGDGIGPLEMMDIMDVLLEKGWCISNIAFGMGGGLHQSHNRDTLKFSMKCCSIKVNGVWNDVYKNPAVYDTDWNVTETTSFKKSKRGLLTLISDGHNYRTINIGDSIPDGWSDIMQLVFDRGVLIRDMSFSDVRRNAGTII